MFCPQCGFQNYDNSQTCSNCGASLAEFQQGPTQRIPERPSQAGESWQDSTRRMPQQDGAQGAYQQSQQTYQRAEQQQGYQQGYQQPGQYSYSQQGGYSSSMPPQQGNGKAVGALVCGICAIVFSGTIILGLVLGIIAIVLGGSALQQSEDGKAKAGRICGIIGLVLSVVTLIISFIFGVTIFSYVMSEANSSRPAIMSTSKSTSSSASSKSTPSSKASSSSAPSSSSAASSAPAPTPAPEPKPQPSPLDLIVGTWSGVAQSGEKMTVEFTSNGTYKVSYEGGSTDIGNYEFNGVNLDIYMASYQGHATVSFPDNDTMQVVNSIGGTETYHRK